MAVDLRGVDGCRAAGNRVRRRLHHRAFAGPLRDAGARVVAPPPQPKHLIDGYLAGLDDAAHGGPIAVGGVSIGAAVAAAWALQHPERAVVVLAALPAWTGAPDSATAALAARHSAQQLRHDGLAATTTQMRASSPPWLAEELTRSWRGQWPHLPDAMDEAAAYVAPTRAQLQQLAVPWVSPPPRRPDSPVHVGLEWAAAAPRAALRTVTLDQIGADPAALGAACLAALGATPLAAGGAAAQLLHRRSLGAAARSRPGESVGRRPRRCPGPVARQPVLRLLPARPRLHATAPPSVRAAPPAMASAPAKEYRRDEPRCPPRLPSLVGQRVDGLGRTVHHAADHPPIAVDPDEPHHAGRGADHLPAPGTVLDAHPGPVLAQRVGELTGHLTPQLPVLGAAYAAMVKRPLAVTTHTALGMPESVSSTCSWPPRASESAPSQGRGGPPRRPRVVEILDVERAIRASQRCSRRPFRFQMAALSPRLPRLPVRRPASSLRCL